MARHDDDDDRPRRRKWDDDEDRPARRRRSDEDDDRPRRRKPGKKSNTGLVVGILVGVFIVFCGGGGLAVYWAVSGVKKAADNFKKEIEAAMAEAEADESSRNLEEIGKAIRKYEAARGSLPNNSYDADGRPLLSWRVHILPYLDDRFEGKDYGELFRKFRQDEPWDSLNNRPLMAQMPEVFEVKIAPTNQPGGMTFYRGFSHPGAIFEKPQDGAAPPPINLAKGVPDGLANTILVIEAGQAVEWTKPDDLDWPEGKPRPDLGGVNPKRDYVVAVMANGKSVKIHRVVKDDTLRLLIHRSDGKPIPPGWEHPGRKPRDEDID